MPDDLFAAWERVSRRIVAAKTLALFTDFDGTLAPIRVRPADVRLSASTRALLAGMAARGHVVGIISGRALGDLRRHVGLTGVWYVGVHGFFLRAPDRRTWTLVRPAARRRLMGIARRLRAELNGVAGVVVEAKSAAVAVHYRLAREAGCAVASRAVFDAVRHDAAVRLLAGHKVWEILPAGAVDKAAAVKRILRHEWRHAPRRRRLAIYLGDDLTDESVFRRWRGLSIAVGPRRRTAARYTLRSPGEVRVFLDRLTKLCSSHRPTPSRS